MAWRATIEEAPPARDATAVGLALGCGCYRAGRFFEASAAWEPAWRVERGDMRRLLHGLIFVAAAMVKARGANPSGTVRLLESALALLCPLPGEVAGIGVARLRADIEVARQQAERWRDGQGRSGDVRPPQL